MDQGELNRCCAIPPERLAEYRRFRGGDCDVQRLSLFLSLRDLDFSPEEAAAYLEALPAERLRRLEARREALLAEVHHREDQLCRLDCLRHALRQGR